MKKVIFLLSFLGVFLILSSCITTGKISPGNLLSAGKQLFNMATLSDDQISTLAKQSATQLDSQNRVASRNNKYAKRLKRLVRRHVREQGLNMDFKVYLSDTVNAFAMSNGTIRFYSGLMSKMNDQELLYIIGHEIGHVVHGHTKQKMQVAYSASIGRKLLSSYDSKIGQLANSQLGAILEKFVNAQFSQSEEEESDDYSLQFMKKHKYKTKATISALNKLAEGRTDSFFANLLASHPSPQSRAERLKAQLM